LNASLSLAHTLRNMDAFFSKVLAASADARRESSSALSTLSTSTTPSTKSDSSDDSQLSPIASSVYVASHKGDVENLSRKSPARDSKTLSRKTLVEFAENCNDVHVFSESPEAQIARRKRPRKTWSFDGYGIALW
jgi:hypothetical protein